MAVVMSGVEGSLRFGHQPAAEVTSWTLAVGNGRYDLACEFEVVSEHWLSQRPLTVSLVLGGTRMEWGGVLVAVDGRRAKATLLGMPALWPEAKQ